MTRSDEDLVKLWIPLPPDDWHGVGAESVWAERVGPDRYRIRNVPFYAYGLSFEDVVEAFPDPDGALELRSVVERGGHSTYRIFLEKGLTLVSPEFLRYWQPIQDAGCSYEGATRRLQAIDVSPEADIHRVYELLAAGEKARIWEFEEGHCGHPTE